MHTLLHQEHTACLQSSQQQVHIAWNADSFEQAPAALSCLVKLRHVLPVPELCFLGLTGTMVQAPGCPILPDIDA